MNDLATCKSNVSTYILRWNSVLSQLFTMSSFELCMKRFDYNLNILSTRIRNGQSIKTGDIVYMVREGDSNTGIVMRGIINDTPHTYDDWCTEENTDRIIDIRVTQIMHPEKSVLPDTRQLEELWNNGEWEGFKQLVLLERRTAENLDNIFKDYLKNNKEQFAINRNNGVAITEYEI